MVKFGVMVKADFYERMAFRAALVDRLGFDSLWVPDHIILENYKRFCPETWCILRGVARDLCLPSSKVFYVSLREICGFKNFDRAK